MGSEWEEVPFNELGEVNRGRSRHRPRYAEHLYGGSYPFIQTGDIRGSNGRIVSHSQTYSEEGLAQSRLWPTGTMCITIAANIAETAILTYPACFPDSVVGFIADERRCEVQFVEYSFRLLKRRLQSEAIGSVQDNINLGTLSRLNILLPPLPEQKAIAHILGSLDDKIELNRQINQTLEAMAQTLFKSWFVDFDPVIDNALAAGNAIPDAFAKRAQQRQQNQTDKKPDFNAHFPAEFEYSEEMGWIPKGWGIQHIRDLVESVSITYPLKTVDKIIFLNTGDILDGKFMHQNFSDVSDLPGQAKKSIQKHDILYSEIRPKNKRYAYVNFDAENYVVSTKLMVLRSTGKTKPLFIYFFLKQEDTISYLQLIAESRSGTFPQITFDVLSKITLSLPKEKTLINHFTNKMLEPIYNKIFKSEEETENLSKLRDTLLPKLLSGELRIPDAEKLLEDINSRVGGLK